MTRQIFTAASAALLALFTCCTGANEAETTDEKEEKAVKTEAQEQPQEETTYEYGIPCNGMIIEKDTFRKNETLAEVLYGLRLNSQQIHALTQCPDSIFDERRIRPGETCTLFSSKDSTALYLVIERGQRAYVKFDIADGMSATRHERPAEWRQQEVAGRVNSSLWVAMEECNASPQLAVLMSHIFGWSIDFFGIQKNDEFRLIYSQEYVDGKPLNSYRIDAAQFCASGNNVYAIPFTQDDEELFYNIDGNSLEGAFLKAPLDFYRISSHFTNSRYHPVLKRHRAHHGVDYAAPKGTPVYAIGSGKVLKKA